MKTKEILIKGAKLHNLKNITVGIPRNKLVVITGLSGSGKSSLAFDTLYAEGQMKNVNTLRLWKSESIEEFDYDAFNSQRFTDAIIERERVADLCRVRILPLS